MWWYEAYHIYLETIQNANTKQLSKIAFNITRAEMAYLTFLTNSTIFNPNETYFTESDNVTSSEDNKKIQLIFDTVQFSMTVIGFTQNVIVYITLSRNGNVFTSLTILRILKNQSVADSIVCLIGSIFVMQPPIWKTSDDKSSTFVLLFYL